MLQTRILILVLATGPQPSAMQGVRTCLAALTQELNFIRGSAVTGNRPTCRRSWPWGEAGPDPGWITTLPSLVPANRSLALSVPPREQEDADMFLLAWVSFASSSVPGDSRFSLGLLNTQQFVEHHVLFWEVTPP